MNSELIVIHSPPKWNKCKSAGRKNEVKSGGRKNEVTKINLKYTQNKLLYLVFHIWKGYEK